MGFWMVGVISLNILANLAIIIYFGSRTLGLVFKKYQNRYEYWKKRDHRRYLAEQRMAKRELDLHTEKIIELKRQSLRSV